MTDAVILNYNDYERTIYCAEKLSNYFCVGHIVIVDNCSTDNSVLKLKDVFYNNDKISICTSKKNDGYGAGNNIGISFLFNNYKSKYILICNPDTNISEKCLENTIKFLETHDDYAVAAPYMCDNTGIRQYNTAFKIPAVYGYICSISILLSRLIHPIYYKDVLDWDDKSKDVGGVSGSLFLFDTILLDFEKKLFDENIFLYNEEMTLAIKCQSKKKKIALLAQDCFLHMHSSSISKSYNTELKRHKIQMKSFYYVLVNYFRASFFQKMIAHLLIAESNLERILYLIIKGR